MRKGFTLLEVVVAIAILGLALMAIFDLNAGAVASHAYVKRLTVATLLARGKMTDLEQKLYDEGLPASDDEQSGDFGEQGWPSYKWRARILAPKTENISSDKVLSAMMGLPAGSDALASLFGGAGAGALGKGDAGVLSSLSSGSGPLPPGATGGGGGMGAGLLQSSMTQLVDQLTKSVREVHLTVTWKDGKQTESLDVVTHVVSLGPGSDRNAPALGATTGVPGTGLPGTQVPGTPGVPGATGVPGQPRIPGLFSPPGTIK